MSRRGLAGLAALFLATLAPAASSTAAVARDGQPVMGTVLTVTVVAGDPSTASSLAAQAIEEARRWDDALTIWRPDGELARFHAAAGKGVTPVSERLRLGLAAMLRLAQETAGAFHPGVGVLRARGARPVFPLPPLVRDLQLREEGASLAAGASLDPGAIGKGLALEAILGMLRRQAVTSAFLDFGGSSQGAVGAPPGDAEGWSVLVSAWKPGQAHGIVKLRDAALSTSRAGAADTTPILDPRTGEPVRGPRLVTVMTADAAAADAWSTALVVLGRTGIELAEEKGIQAFLEDGEGVARSRGFVLKPERGRLTGVVRARKS